MNNDKYLKYFKNLISRVLISIILLLSSLILIKIDSNNRLLINERIYNSTLKFNNIKKWYISKFGMLIPDNKNEVQVFNSDEMKMSEYEKYEDGVKIKMKKNSPVSLLNGGIVIYIGNKEKYGNTVIIQGNDGIDYWYGNITNVNANLYDYLEKDTLIGQTNSDYLYLLFQDDGKYLSYNEFVGKV